MFEIGAWEKDALERLTTEATKAGLAGVWVKPARGMVGEYVHRVGRFTDANTTFHEFAFYTVVGSFFGRKLSFQTGVRPTFANLYTLIIGPSSVARKSTVLDLAVLLAKRLEMHVIPASITPEQLHNHLASQPVGLYAAFEVARFFALARKSYGGDIVEFMLELYDSPDTMVRETVRAGRIEVNSPHFSFLGAGVPAQVRASMGAVDVTGGLAPRFVWVMHQESPLQDFIRNADLPALDALAKKLAQLRVSWPGDPMPLTATAEHEMSMWQHWLTQFLTETLGEMGASFAARYAVTTLKIGAIHAALAGSLVMEARHVRDAAFAMFKTLRTVKNLGAMLRTDAKTSVLMLRVMTHIRTAGVLTRWALIDKMVPAVTATSLNGIIQTLVEGNLIEVDVVKRGPGAGKGRSTTYYTWKGEHTE